MRPSATVGFESNVYADEQKPFESAAFSPQQGRLRRTPRAQHAAPPHHPFSPARTRADGRSSALLRARRAPLLMFTHLHTHTEYSLLDGLSRIPLLMDRAKDLGQEAIGLTDHGVLYGAIQFYKEAKARGIK